MIYIGSADGLAGGRFDGVIVNIHLAVLRELEGELRRLLRPGGVAGEWVLAGAGGGGGGVVWSIR